MCQVLGGLRGGTMINVKTLTGNIIQIDIDPSDKIMRIKVCAAS